MEKFFTGLYRVLVIAFLGGILFVQIKLLNQNIMIQSVSQSTPNSGVFPSPCNDVKRVLFD